MSSEYQRELELENEILVLIKRLELSGFKKTTDKYWPEAFGNRLITLTKENDLITFEKDRLAWSVHAACYFDKVLKNESVNLDTAEILDKTINDYFKKII